MISSFFTIQSFVQSQPITLNWTGQVGCVVYDDDEAEDPKRNILLEEIPKNPESYLWVFPSGCFDACEGELGTIIGPTIPFESWSWNYNNDIIENGNQDFVTPFTLFDAGDYSLTLNNGICEVVADPLSFTNYGCNECELSIKDISITKTNNLFCSFDFIINISSNLPLSYQATITEGSNIVFIPSTLSILPGSNIYNLVTIPINNFNGGVVIITLQGTYVDPKTGEISTCITTFEAIIPSCEGFENKLANNSLEKNEKNTNLNNNVTLYPNPTQNQVTLSYNLVENGAKVYVYDLSGRQIHTQSIEDNTGDLNLNTGSYEAGIYIVVLKQNETIINQQKLIKK